jgi:hypothetical protein
MPRRFEDGAVQRRYEDGAVFWSKAISSLANASQACLECGSDAFGPMLFQSFVPIKNVLPIDLALLETPERIPISSI